MGNAEYIILQKWMGLRYNAPSPALSSSSSSSGCMAVVNFCRFPFSFYMDTLKFTLFVLKL